MKPPAMKPTKNVAIGGIPANTRESVHCFSGCFHARASRNANGTQMQSVTIQP